MTKKRQTICYYLYGCILTFEQGLVIKLKLHIGIKVIEYLVKWVYDKAFNDMITDEAKTVFI